MCVSLCVCTYLMVTENQKSLSDTYTQERNPNITQKIVIKSQGMRAKEEKGTKRTHRNKPPKMNKMTVKYIPSNNFFKCQCSKYSNENI